MAKLRGAQKPRRGKNKKKSWKQLRHGDVDQFLDDIRQDERHGGIKSKPNEELFTLDDLGSINDKFKESDVETVEVKTRATRSKTGPLVRTEDLKCFSLLKPHTAVPDPITKRNSINKRGQGKTAVMALKDTVRQARKKAVVVEETEKCKDPWSMEDPKTILDSQWINPSIKRQNIRQKVRKPKANVTSELPAIEVPHPGFSYNPSFKDHQDLLKTAVSVVEASNRREQRLNKSIAPTKWLSVEKEEPDSEQDDEKYSGIIEDIKPVITSKSKAKTKQQKRKEREEKEKQRILKEKKKDNARLNEVFRIKSLQKSIKKTEKKQKERLAKAVEKKVTREKFGQKKISKFRYEELPLDPALSDELQGRLVGIPAQSSRLTLERFNSLQKRNILEPRVKQRLQRKLRVKKFQKAVDKMDWEKTGYWNGLKVIH